MEERGRVFSNDMEHLASIRLMMERSTRFLSLSGWSGVAAGVSGLVGAWFVARATDCVLIDDCLVPALQSPGKSELINKLMLIGAITFVAALVFAFLFTWMRSRKTGHAIWSKPARSLSWAIALPMMAGALFLFRLIEMGNYSLIAPGSMIFYGLALVNGSRFTLSEVRYLGYCMVILGIGCCWFTNYGLFFWAFGFGVLHIIYGLVMWTKYEKEKPATIK